MVLAIFPNNFSYTPEDKEVEFSMRLAKHTTWCKFKLKDMVFEDKLTL